MHPAHGGFTPTELAIFRRLTTPAKIQRYVDELAYDTGAGGDRCRSPRGVLQEKMAQCMDGALFGAAALRMNGHPPLLLDLEAEHDSDHVLALYRVRGLWGAIAKSNYSGLRFREPVYRTLRELTMSYFENYFNLRREKTLRRYSRPVNLRRFDQRDWMTASEDVWYIPEYLLTIPHTALFTAAAERRLNTVDRRTFAAGLVGHSE